jgi:hypothetical protein
MRATAIAHTLSTLVGLGFGGFVLATACEPQDIYLYDRPPAQTRVGPDAGTNPPPPSEMEDPDEEEDPDDDDAAVPTQPACSSDACEACIDDGACGMADAPAFCHPESGECRLSCQPEATATAANVCPSAQRCHPDLRLCVACVSDDDCSGSAATCDARNVCVECLANDDCIGRGEYNTCSTEEHVCVECISDDDCIAKDPQRPICTSERECEDEEDD